ncbi:MAG: hypothetical protein IPN17_26700 [Deltaproteobacteria bacterium]|nr:hypothetical protein [Deltaproteobacteria bacterium]
MNSASITTPRSRRMVMALSHQPPVVTSSRMEVALRVTPPWPVILRCQSQKVIHDSETFTDCPVRARCSDSSQPVDAYDQQLPIDWLRTSVWLTSVTFSTRSEMPSASSSIAASSAHDAWRDPARGRRPATRNGEDPKT